MPKVTVIPATINPLTHLPNMSSLKRRTAGYARVSTDSDEQFTSYEAQVDYYTRLIQSTPEWEFVKVYTDEGITGTNTKKRDGFNEMIHDALDGKIDLIITKSVSRFARNTVDSLSTIRKLKEHNVECYFEKENIWTFDSKGELLITIMSSLAQEESRSISENVTWGHRKNFSDGKVYMAYKTFLGYEKGENGTPVINEEEAQIVRLIYRLFLNGKTPTGICLHLEQLGILSPRGLERWRESTVRSILTNERYKGDALLQKTFTVDFLQKKTKINKGEVSQYYVENSHPAIIDPDEWDMVQAEFARRKAMGSTYSGRNVLSSKLICEDCGSFFGSKVWHSTDKYRKTIWQCNKKFANEIRCKTPILEMETIQNLFITAYNQLMGHRSQLVEDCELMRKALINFSEIDTAIEKQTKEIQVIADLIKAVVNENASTAQSQEAYIKKYDELTAQYSKATDELSRLQETKTARINQDKELKAFIHNLKKQPEVIDSWDDTLWLVFIEKGIVHQNASITFVFYNGKEITVGT